MPILVDLEKEERPDIISNLSKNNNIYQNDERSKKL